jgi:hypothetical protein
MKSNAAFLEVFPAGKPVVLRLSFLAAVLVFVVKAAGYGPGEGAEGRTPEIRWHQAKAGVHASVEVVHLDPVELQKLAKAELKTEDWTALFAVYVHKSNAIGQAKPPAMLGSYRVENRVLRFEPRFGFQPGLRYRAVFDPARLPGHTAGEKQVVAEFTVAKVQSAPSTVVRQVYPTRNRLPENQLKFYLHFSAPMSRGEAYRHIHLLDAAGHEVDLPFLEIDEELWDPQGLRFTLLFDPGRIKRGLKPREEVGPALVEGKDYTLLIDHGWTDAQGTPLKESYRKRFHVEPPEDRPIDPATWKVQAPTAGTAEHLTVSFPRPLDHALLHRLLWVTGTGGVKVKGTVAVTNEETRWQFTPERPWQAGAYHLVGDTMLEDLAGNRIGQPFEVDVFRPIQRTVKTKTVAVPFQVGLKKPSS